MKINNIRGDLTGISAKKKHGQSPELFPCISISITACISCMSCTSWARQQLSWVNELYPKLLSSVDDVDKDEEQSDMGDEKSGLPCAARSLAMPSSISFLWCSCTAELLLSHKVGSNSRRGSAHLPTEYSHLPTEYRHLPTKYRHLLAEYRHLLPEYRHLSTEYRHLPTDYRYLSLEYVDYVLQFYSFSLWKDRGYACKTVYKRYIHDDEEWRVRPSCAGGTSGRKIACVEDLRTQSLRGGTSGRLLEITVNHSKSSKIASAEVFRTQFLCEGLLPPAQLGTQIQ